MLFTIGSSTRSAPEFFGELKRRGISRLVDVRSSPYSRLPHFNREIVARIASQQGVRYDWAGAILGGRNELPTIDPQFAGAVDWLLTISAQERVAIFCAEGDPKDCHRSWKVGASLLVRYGLVMINVLRDGADEDCTASLLRTRRSSIPPCVRDEALRLAKTAEPALSDPDARWLDPECVLVVSRAGKETPGA